jgi:hypothetical protein
MADSCAAQSTVSPEVYVLYDQPVPTKFRGVAVRQGQNATLEVILFSRAGNAIDLTGCGLSTTGSTTSLVKLRVREAIGLSTNVVEIDGSIPDAAAGKVSFLLGGTNLNAPGVYHAEVGIFDSLGNLRFSDLIYLLVERGLFGTLAPEAAGGGPPTLHEVRLALRDTNELNRLTDVVAYDVADVCDALVTSVQQFNAALPPIPLVLNTADFPKEWRASWMTGIKAHLLGVMANYYAANSLEYQAAGVTVNDLGKHQLFLAMSDRLEKQWLDWIKKQKAAENLSACWGSLESEYAYG